MASLVLFNGASKLIYYQQIFNSSLFSIISCKSNNVVMQFLFYKIFLIIKNYFEQKLKPAFWESLVRMHVAKQITQQSSHHGTDH